MIGWIFFIGVILAIVSIRVFVWRDLRKKNNPKPRDGGTNEKPSDSDTRDLSRFLTRWSNGDYWNHQI